MRARRDLDLSILLGCLSCISGILCVFLFQQKHSGGFIWQLCAWFVLVRFGLQLTTPNKMSGYSVSELRRSVSLTGIKLINFTHWRFALEACWV